MTFKNVPPFFTVVWQRCHWRLENKKRSFKESPCSPTHFHSSWLLLLLELNAQRLRANLNRPPMEGATDATDANTKEKGKWRGSIFPEFSLFKNDDGDRVSKKKKNSNRDLTVTDSENIWYTYTFSFDVHTHPTAAWKEKAIRKIHVFLQLKWERKNLIKEEPNRQMTGTVSTREMENKKNQKKSAYL